MQTRSHLLDISPNNPKPATIYLVVTQSTTVTITIFSMIIFNQLLLLDQLLQLVI